MANGSAVDEIIARFQSVADEKIKASKIKDEANIFFKGC